MTPASASTRCAPASPSAPPDGTFFFKHVVGRFIRVSRACADLIGRSDRETGMPEEFEFAGHPDRVGPGSWFQVTIAPDRDASGAAVGLLASMRDTSEVKKAQRALKGQALHDPGLANRILLMDRLEAALARIGQAAGEVAILFVDVDLFEPVNDRYGHEVGDRVLIEVARRLERTVDAGDTVARHGGDEYVVLCSWVDGEAIAVSVSVGVMVTDDPATSADALLSGADAAMYQAKQSGRRRWSMAR